MYFLQHTLELIEAEKSGNLDAVTDSVAVLGRERETQAKGVRRASSERLVFR